MCGGGGGIVSRVTSTVSNAVQRVAAPVVSVAQKAKDFSATPTGSAMLPYAAVFSPTGRENLMKYAQTALPVVGGMVGGPMGSTLAQTAGAVGGELAGNVGVVNNDGGMFGGGGGGNQDVFAQRFNGGGGGGGGYMPEYLGQPRTNWGLIAGIAAGVIGLVLVLVLVFKRK